MFATSHLVYFNKKTAYELRISDGSSDVCSSDLDGAFEFLPKNRPDGSAAAAIPADQTVAIGLVAALLSQVARFEDQRRNCGPDPVDRWRGIAESEPIGDQRRGERGAAQTVGRIDAGRGQHGIARRGEVDMERAAGLGQSAIPAIDAGDGKDALIGAIGRAHV